MLPPVRIPKTDRPAPILMPEAIALVAALVNATTEFTKKANAGHSVRAAEKKESHQIGRLLYALTGERPTPPQVEACTS